MKKFLVTMVLLGIGCVALVIFGTRNGDKDMRNAGFGGLASIGLVLLLRIRLRSNDSPKKSTSLKDYL